MHSVNHLWEQVIDEDYICRIIPIALRGKKKNKRVKGILNNVSKHARNIRNALILGTLPSCYARNPKVIHESNANKDRIIQPPSLYEHIVHHLICDSLQPLFMRGMHDNCLASVPNRGDSYGKERLRKWLDNRIGTPLYCLKIDVHHFFQSIDRQILFNLLSQRIRDQVFMQLIWKVLYYDGDLSGVGIPIGFYTSQWFANYYLQELDHLISETWHADMNMRYMDDVVILSSDKYRLHIILNNIQTYLFQCRHLTLNDNWQVFRYSYRDSDGSEKGRSIDFMGYVFHWNRTTIRKKTLQRTRQKAKTIQKKLRKSDITWFDAAQMISRLGRLRRADVYDYYQEYLKSNINVHYLKFKVANASRIAARIDYFD